MLPDPASTRVLPRLETCACVSMTTAALLPIAGDLANAARMPVVVMATESTGSGRAEDADSASGGWHGLHKVDQFDNDLTGLLVDMRQTIHTVAWLSAAD